MRAISSGSTMPSICRPVTEAIPSLRSIMRITRSVRVVAGATALTRTLCSAYSTAIDRVIAATPPFDAV